MDNRPVDTDNKVEVPLDLAFRLKNVADDYYALKITLARALYLASKECGDNEGALNGFIYRISRNIKSNTGEAVEQ